MLPRVAGLHILSVIGNSSHTILWTWCTAAGSLSDWLGCRQTQAGSHTKQGALTAKALSLLEAAAGV